MFFHEKYFCDLATTILQGFFVLETLFTFNRVSRFYVLRLRFIELHRAGKLNFLDAPERFTFDSRQLLMPFSLDSSLL